MAPSSFPSHPSGLCSSFNRLCLEDHNQSLPPHPPDLCSSFDRLRLEDHNLSTQTQPDVNSTTTCQSFSSQPSRLRSSWHVLDLDITFEDPIDQLSRYASFCGPINMYPEDNDPAKWTVLEVVAFLCRDEPMQAFADHNNLIDGNSLLYHVCERNIQGLPGLRIIPHHQYVLCVIAWLQLRSPRFTLGPAGAYRIGQRKPVSVYRMIAGGTFEEKLDRENAFKSQLTCRVGCYGKDSERVCSESNDFPNSSYTSAQLYDVAWQVIPQSDFDKDSFAYGRAFSTADPPAQDATKMHPIPWKQLHGLLDSFGPLRNTDLRFRISQIDGAPDVIGPVVSLLLAVKALWQQVGSTTALARITSLDHAGLIDFRARFVEGEPRVVRAMREDLGASLDSIRDAAALAEGLLLVDRCIETMADTGIRAEIEAIATLMRPPPQTPLPSSQDMEQLVVRALRPEATNGDYQGI
ncbi:hypothetical protein PENSOL_c046G06824 [Penicillium solitum]|uniref:Uncharacterized protein n=1 Tax=Penicillium solitum TaxID=60172 RepID=A0A1V6QSL5_9EURO|nr:uncharacterized protein PENSOL_c046G06824 [Penicillium solitum]OQD91952.1 hypothetical protein PENSOL_c046G06824 [Penicillium solitum]